VLRLETETGWWLVTHQDHARLAGRFAEHWGNAVFTSPEPRQPVLLAISAHDDGWAQRDAAPQITRSGVPAAFSVELVGKYSAFEEIDLADYIAVRERAVAIVAERDPYAGLLVSLHTNDLLTTRADRSTIAPAQLPLLDAFLERQAQLRASLLAACPQSDAKAITSHFRLLQATDNLSLLACVDYGSPATLLHPLLLNSGEETPVGVKHLGERHFQLSPWPFDESPLVFGLPAKHVEGKRFSNAVDLQAAYAAAPVIHLEVRITA
jgi:hypothetical protein